MPNPTSPIDLALNAVYKLFSDPAPALTAYTDDSSSNLDRLAQGLITTEEVPVLIRMGTKEAKKRQPYGDLLEQVIEDRHLGISGSVHSIVTNLLENHKKIKPNSQLSISKSDNRSKNNLKIGDAEIDTPEQRAAVLTNLLNWAKLESTLIAPKTPFSRLAGGIRPLVYVFDDYTNFINKEPKQDEVYNLATAEITPEVKEFYQRSSSSQSEELDRVITGFCRCLNNLSVAFEIKTPNMAFPADVKIDLGKKFNYFEQIAKILGFEELDKTRNQIGAFIIDLEWLPSPKWIEQHPKATFDSPSDKQEMGHYAVRLLTQRYPEIPCFIFTGMWSIETLQQSLAAGAAWCFQKPLTHHIGSGSHPSEELNYFNLERHLTEFAKRTYGTYEQLPNPKQFDTKSHPAIVSELNKKMSMDLEQNDDPANGFRKLVAGQFIADSVNPTKVLIAGKSGALATFFAQPTSSGEKEATRFVKIDSWLNTQTEYFAYQHIIRPRLNNHVAHIIQKPSVTPIDKNNSESIGIITSSLAGFPEDYSKLKTLKEIIDRYINEPGGVQLISNKIYATLEMVLLPLYQNHTPENYWMGEDFFPWYEGELISISQIPDRVDRVVYPSDIQISGNKKTLDTSSLDNLQDKDMFWLKGWQIAWIEDRKKTEHSPHTKCVVLTSPLLRHQIRLKTTDIKDFERRFNGIWTKPNICVELVASLNNTNDSMTWNRTKILELSGYATVNELINSLKISDDHNENDLIIDPFDILKNKCVFKGRKAVRHGDLNPNNILYPKNDEVGFLIDFARTKNNELIAFDMAWMEVQLWNYYVFPELIEIANKTQGAKLSLHQTLFLSLKSLDPTRQDLESWRFSNNLSSSLKNSFKIINSIRQFTIDKLPEISLEEQNYSLGVSFLRHSRFDMHYDRDKDVEDKLKKIDVNTKSKIMSFLAAAYYLSKMPRCESN